jgi:hypothetical protein
MKTYGAFLRKRPRKSKIFFTQKFKFWVFKIMAIIYKGFLAIYAGRSSLWLEVVNNPGET